jgi:hypothetical protein
MGNAQTNVADIQQSVTNQIVQDNQQSCTFVNQGSANGNINIFNNVRVKGNVTGTNLVSQTTDSTCVLSSNMSSSVSSILSAALQTTNKTESDWFGGFSFSAQTNVFDVNQVTTNQINQINQSTCSSNITRSANNNFTYLSGSVGGNVVGVNLSLGQSSASCSMQNTMKSISYNDGQANNSDDNTEKGMFVSMVSSFTTMVGLIVVLVIVLFAVGAIGYVGYSVSSRPKAPPATSGTGAAAGMTVEQQEEAELALYDQYGGTSFITGPTPTSIPSTAPI